MLGRTQAPAEPARLRPADLVRRFGLVPQNPGDLLYLPSVAAECAEADQRSARDARTLPRTPRAPGRADRCRPRTRATCPRGSGWAWRIAVVMTSDPPLLALDEPTRGLDYPARRRLGACWPIWPTPAAACCWPPTTSNWWPNSPTAPWSSPTAGCVDTGSAEAVLTATPAFAPAMAKVFRPVPMLTPSEAIAAALDVDGRMTRAPMVVAGLAATVVGFGWPFLAAGHPGVLAGDAMAPLSSPAVLALVLVWLLAEVTRGGLDAKAVALLGLLTALGVALRAVGPAVAGLEPTFALIILAARVFGGTSASATARC